MCSLTDVGLYKIAQSMTVESVETCGTNFLFQMLQWQETCNRGPRLNAPSSSCAIRALSLGRKSRTQRPPTLGSFFAGLPANIYLGSE